MNKRLYWALAISLIAHLAFATFVHWEPPEPPEAPKMTARFEALPPPPTSGYAPKVERKKVVTKKAPPPTAAAPVAIVVPEEEAEMPPSTAAEEPLKETLAQAEPTIESKPEPVPEQKPEPEPEPIKPTPPTPSKPKGRHETLPRVIDLQYAAGHSKNGSYPMPVGNMTLRFTHEDGKYQLTTVGRAKGFFAFMYPGALKMVSQGIITERGIRPDKFSIERNDPTKTRHVVFDWDKKLVTLRDKEPAPISEPTFDVLTFIIQFYFSMPSHVAGEPVTLQVASPTRLDEYTLKREDTVTLKTPLGDIEADRWVGTRKTAIGQAEFWLAPKWHYIPFKVALTSEHGDTAVFNLETVATEDKS